MPTKNLPCPLTDGEILHKALASADLGVEFERLDEERAASAKAYREAMKDIRSRRRALDRAIRDRTEMRSVETREIHDGRRLSVDTLRLDTGEIIGSRAMTAAERQVEITMAPLPPPPPPAPVAPGPTGNLPHIIVPPGRAETIDLSAQAPTELAAIAEAAPPRAMTEPALTDEERAEVRRQYEAERAAQRAAQVEQAFAPAPSAPPRVPRTVQLAAEVPPSDPLETRFGLVLDEVARDEPTKAIDAPGPA